VFVSLGHCQFSDNLKKEPKFQTTITKRLLARNIEFFFDKYLLLLQVA
jgi:hypothetical protein